jgi:hypothetical protein
MAKYDSDIKSKILTHKVKTYKMSVHVKVKY